MTPQGFFVTATDTGVGKTVFTALAVAALRSKGVDCLPVKPVQTGCEPEEIAPDLDFSLRANNLHPPAELLKMLCPVSYRAPASPHLASELEGMFIDPQEIFNALDKLAEGGDYLAVEGAGGLMVPINRSYLMLDLIEELELPVFIVSRLNLGTINHTLLTIEALKKRQIDIAGVVFNQPRPLEKGYVEKDNPRVIKKFGEVEIIGEIPYIPDLEELVEKTDNIWLALKKKKLLDFNLPAKLQEVIGNE
ncbi:MAG: dethiobiotin synthase [bacterium]